MLTLTGELDLLDFNSVAIQATSLDMAPTYLEHDATESWENTELFKGLKHKAFQYYFTINMHGTQRTVAARVEISYWVIKKKSMSMETRLAGFLGACVCVCVCAHSWVCTVHACTSGWMSVSESCVFVQSLPEVV